MKIIIFCCTFMVFTTSNVKAQTTKNIDHINQLWFGYVNQIRVSNKWELWTDVNLRTKRKFVNNFSVGIARLGITYYISPTIKLRAGFAWIDYFPGDNHKNITQPEHRPWQQIQWQTKYGKNTMVQSLGLEERFRRKILNDDELARGYNFNYRVRYNLRFEIPLDKKEKTPGNLSLVAYDEIDINAGKEIVNNYFDQNRLYAGLKFRTGASTNVQLGYLNIFQQQSAGNQYKSVQLIRLFFYQNIDLRHNPSVEVTTSRY